VTKAKPAGPCALPERARRGEAGPQTGRHPERGHEPIPAAPGFAYAQQSQMMITKLPPAGWL
jgi:hypothetical protein